ncbi:F0F1 ATP synthase subunit delta [Campylobacter sp. RM9344]|uniref:ATP synthase subunit delta n=1 Tax=Campylobacter californiensis TaxID=1032243 RepID=A0AAW3ZS81_9BACT|nr:MULTISPECIES: F0F1 ATP synthase subunit delta [unclassified Campylobacter]MBE2984413.1 F0F1 ATP synthase subunit delta [Campylobacter sp. RM6883]MBE2985751.1 F0F1 ATP synthase subunit delta [Campylobacter sp. RM12919]MBE2987866.1 F0F1 ATP synthase subunit delta [Campylobacter sp. RM12920]MBE2995057.1 F0F1 ATP synthase subunit delta [Campylobacter sp. RM6913]MBE3029679.1 F0F1 ATP synthase subunit delta [Campylobacter sp. RM9344]
MNEAVTKKYVKAILGNLNANDLEKFVANLAEISAAFGVEKFRNIINLPTLKSMQKVEFILSLVNNPSQNFVNFIKLLGSNKRLEIIPAVLAEIKAQQAKLNNIYNGNVVGNFNINDDQLKSLEENFSKRFDAKVKLEGENSDYNGIKIELDSLGVEVNFSIDRLKAQLSEHILKAI